MTSLHHPMLKINCDCNNKRRYTDCEEDYDATSFQTPPPSYCHKRKCTTPSTPRGHVFRHFVFDETALEALHLPELKTFATDTKNDVAMAAPKISPRIRRPSLVQYRAQDIALPPDLFFFRPISRDCTPSKRILPGVLPSVQEEETHHETTWMPPPPLKCRRRPASPVTTPREISDATTTVSKDPVPWHGMVPKPPAPASDKPSGATEYAQCA